MIEKVAKNLLLDQLCNTCKTHVAIIDQNSFNSFIKCDNNNRKTYNTHISNNNYTKVDLSSTIKCDERGTCEFWRSS